ncbi:Uncharacterized protein HZ326_12084 [Fusarium oxysporum f. sp. albedinis]|nr:Uncharacterized protein HZ326_12084 [Fusarium oxysporum f. sp. albedinis]
MYVVAGSKRLAAKEDTRPVFKLIASHCTSLANERPILKSGRPMARHQGLGMGVHGGSVIRPGGFWLWL